MLAVVGDFEPAQAKAFVEKYFAAIPSTKLPPQPDLSEPRQEKEKRATKKDSLATKPALAFAYHMPDRNTPEYYAMGLLDQLLLQGNDSKLYQALVQRKAIRDRVSGGINYLGNMFNYEGPMLWMGNLIYDSTVPADSVVRTLDAVIADVDKNGVTQSQLDLARVKLRSDFYDMISSGFGRADLLAALALFDNKPDRINMLEDEFKKVTSALIQRTVREYLRPTNRTLLFIEPAKKAN